MSTESAQKTMKTVGKVAEDLGHNSFVRPVFNPVQANAIDVALPFDIISWAKNMTARTEELERRIDIATKCPICMDNDKTRALATCGHGFCTNCIRQVESLAADDGPLCPICRTSFVANSDQPRF